MSQQPSPNQIIKAKLYTATALIREGNKDAARSVLLTMPHDANAQRLLMQLGDTPEVRPEKRTSLGWVIMTLLLMFITAGISILASVYISRETDPLIVAGKTFAAAFPTDMPETATAYKQTEAALDATMTMMIAEGATSDIRRNMTMTAIFAPNPTDTPSPFGKWQQGKNTSAIDDSENTYIYLESESSTLTSPQAIFIRCENKKLEAFINAGESIDPTCAGCDESRFRIRFDKNDPDHVVWNLSTNQEAVFADDDKEFVDQLIASEKFVVEYTSYLRETSREAVFQLKGLQEAIKPVYAACGIN